MGIRGLERLILHSSLSQHIDIRGEIAKWRREHYGDPTIIVDVKELNRRIADIEFNHPAARALTLGGRYDAMNNLLDNFFAEMKKANAKLVFFARLGEGRYEDIDNHITPFRVYDRLMKAPHRKHPINSTIRPNERLLFNLLYFICPKYGEVIADYGIGKATIMAYARKNANVLALITRNTEFLVLGGSFEYWSLSDIDFNQNVIVKFDVVRLDETLGLTQEQKHLLAALSRLKKTVTKKLVITKSDNFFGLVEYVKSQHCNKDGYDVNQLTGNLEEDHRICLAEILQNLKGYMHYSGHWNADIHYDLVTNLMKNDGNFASVVNYCKKHLFFAYKLINELSTVQKDLLFIDIRQPDSITFIDLVIGVTMKLCGIVFKDVDFEVQPTTRSVSIKRCFDGDVHKSEMNIVYPDMALPQLSDLLMNEGDGLYDDSRWKLFQWLLGLNTNDVSMAKMSMQRIRVAVFTLKFLVTHQIITKQIADIVLFSELSESAPFINPDWHVEIKDISWVLVAHKYTIAYELVCHCLELSGLHKEMTPITFDAHTFHRNMLDSAYRTERQRQYIEDMIMKIRIW